jgi:hypothetical protein
MDQGAHFIIEAAFAYDEFRIARLRQLTAGLKPRWWSVPGQCTPKRPPAKSPQNRIDLCHFAWAMADFHEAVGLRCILAAVPGVIATVHEPITTHGAC